MATSLFKTVLLTAVVLHDLPANSLGADSLEVVILINAF